MVKRLLQQAFKTLWHEEEDFTRKHLTEPASLIELLPYRLFDKDNHVFINSNSIGIVLEFNPLICNISEEQEKNLSKLLSGGLEHKTTIQIYRWENPHSGFWLKVWSDRHHTVKNPMIKRILQERYEYLKGSNKECLFNRDNFFMRDVRCFVAISMPLKNSNDSAIAIQKLKIMKEHFIESLTGFSGFTYELLAEDFLNVCDQWIHPDFSLNRIFKQYDALQPLHHQLYNGSQSLEVVPTGILFEDLVAQTLTVEKVPHEWATWRTPGLNGEDTNQFSRAVSPTLSVTTFTALEYVKSVRNTNSRRKSLEALFKQEFVRKHVPRVEDEYKDWNYAQECLDREGDKLVKSFQTIIVFDKRERINKSVATLMSMYGEKNWTLSLEKYGHFPAFLYCLPFMPSEGMYEDFCTLGRLKTRLTSTCASLTNFYGDSKGVTSTPGLLLQGRHGQPFFFNPFISNSNYNVAIVGVPGAGKSVLMQELVTFILAKGGEVIVIDDGYSFKHSSILLKGEHIVIQGDISINPFSMIDAKVALKDDEYLNDGLILVESMLGCMIQLRDGVDKSEWQRLNFAVREAWSKKQNTATVTDVASILAKYKTPSGSVDPVAMELNQLLNPFCSGGSMGKYFNRPHTINIRNSYTVYEMSVLNGNRTLQSLVLMMIMFMVSEKMYHGDRSIPKAIVIDEAWNLLSGKGTAKFIEGIARRARKYKASLITGTQDLNDYALGAPNAAWNASNWKIIMNQSGGAIDNASSGDNKLLNLSKYSIQEAKSLCTAKGKYSELMIVESSNDWGIIGRLALDPYSITIYSSDASDVSSIQNIQKTQNVSLSEAIDVHANTKRNS